MRRVRLENYKSIGRCDVGLAPLTVLVGRNGSGKSNFLDALGFIGDSLRSSLDHAVRERGGLRLICRHSIDHPRSFEIEVEITLDGGVPATYAIKIDSKAKGGEFWVAREKLVVGSARVSPLEHSKTSMRFVAEESAAPYHSPAWYEVEDGEVVSSSLRDMPPAAPDRLYLVTASGLRQFRPAYDALVSMGFYNLNPETMKRPQSPDAGELLHRDGWNIASVIARLERDAPDLEERVVEYLRKIVPGVQDFRRIELGPQETVQFHQEVQGAQSPWSFYAMAMSDGTLRALGILIAAFQPTGRHRVRLVGIEEPETALHPAAAGALIDALREATAHTQVLLTTHSPDLIDGLDFERDKLLVVHSHGGTTELAEPDQASLTSIKDHLMTPGELLRMDQLEPDPHHLEEQQKLRLFAFGPQTNG